MVTILGVALKNRKETSLEFQKILSENGCNIRTRLGLHPVEGCVNDGVVLLEVCGDATSLIEALKVHWDVQTMVFN